jgi:hypothetical protein
VRWSSVHAPIISKFQWFSLYIFHICYLFIPLYNPPFSLIITS